MKFSILSAGAMLASLATAAPTKTTEQNVARAVVKAAAITDACDIGYASQNGGTTGGTGGTTVTVADFAAFTAAVTNDKVAKVIVVSGTITGNAKVRLGSNKTLVGLPGSKLVGIGLFVWKQSNVIIRNIVSQDVLASAGDAIGIQKSTNVWVDHCELYSDLTHDKDYYDGLMDVTHASDFITISNTYLHDHWKASLVGHSDNNGDEDTGFLHVTFANNHWGSIGSRGPSVRFGSAHIYNSYYENASTGINTRQNSQILVQSNVFTNVTDPLSALYSDVPGYANAFDNDFGSGNNTAPVGKLTATSVTYKYTLLGSAAVKAAVVGTAGATLKI